MSLYAKFSLTPREPFKYLYDFNNSHWKYFANLTHHGVYLDFTEIASLEGSYNNNWVYFSSNTVSYPFPDPFPSDYYRHAIARLNFKTDAPTDKQYLILFHVRSYNKIGVYLNGNLVREEDCNGDETIPVLVDCPGPGVFDKMYIVPHDYALTKGVDCYVI